MPISKPPRVAGRSVAAAFLPIRQARRPSRHNAARAFRGPPSRLKFLPSVQGGEARLKVKMSAGPIWYAPRGPRNGPRADQARANRLRRFDPPRFTITMVQPPTARAREKAAASDSPRRLGRARASSSSAGSMSQSGKPRHPRRSNCNRCDLPMGHIGRYARIARSDRCSD